MYVVAYEDIYVYVYVYLCIITYHNAVNKTNVRNAHVCIYVCAFVCMYEHTTR